MFAKQPTFGRLMCNAVLLAIFFQCADALTCFETNDDGDMIEASNDEWTYCVILPERIEDNKFVEGRAFGVGPNSDLTSAYDPMFAGNTDLYRILSVCVQERYDFGRISPKFTFKQPEFMLRCFCNYDLCNKEKNFFAYMNNLKDESSSLDIKQEGKKTRTLSGSLTPVQSTDRLIHALPRPATPIKFTTNAH